MSVCGFLRSKFRRILVIFPPHFPKHFHLLWWEQAEHFFTTVFGGGKTVVKIRGLTPPPTLSSSKKITHCSGFDEQVSKHLIVKHLATLRPCTALGDVTEVRILVRIVRWVKPPHGSGRERIKYEADPRHAKLTIHQLGLCCSSRSVSTPSEKPKLGVDLSIVRNGADHTLYRSATMRLWYLALDRPDLQFPTNELARWMQAPTVGNLEALKRVASYSIGHGRLIQEFVRQVEEPSHSVVFTDSDDAGCLKTRKSTSSSSSSTGEGNVSRTSSRLHAQRSGS